MRSFLPIILLFVILNSCSQKVRKSTELYLNSTNHTTYLSEKGEPFTGLCSDTTEKFIDETIYKKGKIVGIAHKTVEGKLKWQVTFNDGYRTGELYYDYKGDGKIIPFKKYVEKYYYLDLPRPQSDDYQFY